MFEIWGISIHRASSRNAQAHVAEYAYAFFVVRVTMWKIVEMNADFQIEICQSALELS